MASVLGIGFSALVAFVLPDGDRETAPQFGALALLAVAGGLLRRGARDSAAALIMATLTATLLALAISGGGLRDTSMVGLPGVLVVAALLGNRRHLAVLSGVMMAVVGALGAAGLAGLYVAHPRPVGAATVVNLLVILGVIAAVSALLAGDLLKATNRLRGELEDGRRARERIEYLATHDALTGLPNRLMARDHFDLAAAAARRSDAKVALLYLDLDHFKTVNDSLGHPAGDALLQRMGQRLRQTLRAGDTVSRQGGDEFLVVLGDMPHGDAVAEVAGKVLAMLAEPQVIDDVEIHLGASMGVALYPNDGSSFDALMKKADIAMYRAKGAGRNTMRFFDVAMQDSVSEHLSLVGGMRRALERGEFALHYQPQLCLRSGRVIGAEALLRWNRPGVGMVPPSRFVPVAEQSGQIVEIGAWVLMEACAQAREWQRQGLGALVVSVNLSPVQVRRGALERDVCRALERSGLDASALELELTESLLIEDSDALRAALARLRERGVRFSIDDFGTGYSNLAYLKRFEFERLKIDQSFVRRMAENTNDEAIVRAIVQMAQALRMGVIAEGVEDATTLARLRALGCHEGQGYHWAKPLAAADFAAFIHRHRQAEVTA